MKLNRFFILSLLTTGLVLSSCKDNENYQWGEPAGENTVSFVGEQNLVLDFTATDFNVNLMRVNKGDLPALKVPIQVLDAPEFVTVDPEAVFAEGDTTATIKVKIGEGMKAFTDYKLSLMFDQKYTNPYVDSLDVDLRPRYNVTFLKEDYKLYATGTFLDQVLYGDEWEVAIEYSEMLDLYRVPDAMNEGTAWYFKWNGPDAEEQEFYFTDSEGQKASCNVGGDEYYGFFSGVISAKYGNIFATVLDGYPCGFFEDDEDGPYFLFPLEFQVPAGSFGANFEYIYNLQFVE